MRTDMHGESPRRKSSLKALLRLDLRQTFVSRRSSGLIQLALNVARRLEKIGRKRRRFHIMGCPPLNLWMTFLPLRAEDVPRFVHQVYLKELWRERGIVGRLGLAIGALIWSVPLNIFAVAWLTIINGRAIARSSGKSIARLVLEQFHVAFAHNIMAPWYYQFDLHDDRKRERAGAYVHRFELKGGLYKMVSRRSGALLKSPLNNKQAFAEICARVGLPTLPVIAIARGGAILDHTGGEVELPAGDIFVKPLTGRGGLGAERWSYAENSWRSADGQKSSTDALMRHVEALSRSEPYVIQRRAVPHPDLAELSNGALPTARILTVKGDGESWEPVAALFRMAVGVNRTVDNFHAGGIAANIDLTSGTLGRATDIGLTPDIGWLDRHPDVGGAITGRVLPFWSDVLALARRAHSIFNQRLVAGWDIAILPEGPVLVEGNVAPDTDMHQRVSGLPLGTGQFGMLFAAHLLQAMERVPPHREPATV
jgi:hypothetical protein